jgi:N-hydroxyarylamine O-acetyltransferase
MINTGLLDDVLHRIGHTHAPEVTSDGLNSLFEAWCRCIPFDNVHRLAHFRCRRPGPLPGFDPEGFLETYVTSGIGGTCTPTSGGLWWLLSRLGFTTYRALGAMHPPEIQPRCPPDHTTLVVIIDGHKYLVDTSIMRGSAIPLTDSPADFHEPLHPISIRPGDAIWSVRWQRPVSRQPLVMTLFDVPAKQEELLEVYEATRVSGSFNDALYAKRNTSSGCVVFAKEMRYKIDTSAHQDAAVISGQLAKLLGQEMGYSGGILAEALRDS